MHWLTANNEVEVKLKKMVVAYFNMLSRHIPGEIEENHDNLSQDGQCPGRD
jgi:hypothetical protein